MTNKRRLKRIVKKRKARGSRRPRVKLSQEARALRDAANMNFVAASINLLAALINVHVIDGPYPKLVEPKKEPLN